jgi:hypothetical protein
MSPSFARESRTSNTVPTNAGRHPNCRAARGASRSYPIQRALDGADIVDLGLHLDHQQEPGAWVEGEDVHPSPAAIPTDFDLTFEHPPVGAESTRRVDRAQPMDGIPLWSNQVGQIGSERVADAERQEQAVDVTDPQVPDTARFDPANLSLRDTRSSTQLALAPTGARAGRPHRGTNHVEKLPRTDLGSHGRWCSRRRLSRAHLGLGGAGHSRDPSGASSSHE